MRAQLAVLRNRRFALLTASRTISVLGNGFGTVALAFAILALPGGTPARLSVVQAALALPQLLVLVGGVIADRVPRAWLMVCAELVAGLGYAGLAAMVLTGWSPLGGLVALAVLGGLGYALFQPAYTGMVPEVVAAADLPAANALQRFGMNVGRILGFALAGGTVAVFGAGWALAADAASYLVSAVLIAFAAGAARRAPATVGLATAPAGARSAADAGAAEGGTVRRARVRPLADLREGWREFAGRQWLWVIVAQFSVLMACINAFLGVLGPLAARQDGGPTAWSAILVAQTIGTFAGLVVAVRIRPRRPMLVATLATLALALPLLALGLGAPLWATVAAAVVCGVGIDVFGVLWTTTLQREVPAEAISRVSSWDIFGSLAMAPVGAAVAGPLAVTIGVRPTLVASAVLMVLVTAAALAAPEVRRLPAR
ncbi:MAG TPA: MFS transporter [Actinocatenispora sp.]